MAMELKAFRWRVDTQSSRLGSVSLVTESAESTEDHGMRILECTRDCSMVIVHTNDRQIIPRGSVDSVHSVATPLGFCRPRGIRS
jgi:hypothetical protein